MFRMDFFWGPKPHFQLTGIFWFSERITKKNCGIQRIFVIGIFRPESPNPQNLKLKSLRFLMTKSIHFWDFFQDFLKICDLFFCF